MCNKLEKEKINKLGALTKWLRLEKKYKKWKLPTRRVNLIRIEGVRAVWTKPSLLTETWAMTSESITLTENICLRRCSGTFIQKPPEVFCKKVIFKNVTNVSGKCLCWSLFLIKLKTSNSFSCKIWAIFKTTYFEKHLWATASVYFNFEQIFAYRVL